MSDHADLRRGLPAFVLGMSSDEATATIEAHLETCVECRELAAALSVDAPGPGVERAHIPAGVLARWPRASRELRGLERELIANHLESCEACRSALAVLGYLPELGTLAERPAPPGMTQPASARHWALWSWAALSTAAAFVLALSQWSPSLVSGPGRSTGESSTPRAIETTAPEAPRRPAAMARAGARVNIASPRRDGGFERTTLRRVPGSWTPVFTPLLSSPADSVEVALLDRGGAPVIRMTLTGDALVNDGLLLETGNLLPGDYTLLVSWRKSDGSMGSREYLLRVEH